VLFRHTHTHARTQARTLLQSLHVFLTISALLVFYPFSYQYVYWNFYWHVTSFLCSSLSPLPFWFGAFFMPCWWCLAVSGVSFCDEHRLVLLIFAKKCWRSVIEMSTKNDTYELEESPISDKQLYLLMFVECSYFLWQRQISVHWYEIFNFPFQTYLRLRQCMKRFTCFPVLVDNWRPYTI
jgi:hypothetical protein